MRDLAITLLIPAALLWGLTKTRGALIVLAWICFMRPYDFSWGIWNAVPCFRIALAAAMLSALMHRGFRFNLHPFLLLYLAFLAWAGLGCLSALRPEASWEFYKTFLATFWVVSVFMFGTLRSLNTLKWVAWVSAASLTLVGFKVGLSLGLSGGSHVTDQINGFVGDNNVFGLTLVLAVATLMGLRHAVGGARIRLALWPVIAFALLAVIYTESRGAFLSLALIFLVSSLNSRNPLRNTVILLVLSFAAYAIIPSQFFHRLNTFQDIDNDASAMHRVLYWHFGFRMANSHPLFGVGLDNFKAYTDAYFRNELQGRFSQVAHNVYVQILSETGYPGLLIYLAMVLWTLVALHRLYLRSKHFGRAHPDLHWVEMAAFWMRNGWLGYLFGSAFLNMLVLDFPWYFMWYSHLLVAAVDGEIRRRQKSPAVTGPVTGTLPAHPAPPMLPN